MVFMGCNGDLTNKNRDVMPISSECAWVSLAKTMPSTTDDWDWFCSFQFVLPMKMLMTRGMVYGMFSIVYPHYFGRILVFYQQCTDDDNGKMTKQANNPVPITGKLQGATSSRHSSGGAKPQLEDLGGSEIAKTHKYELLDELLSVFFW